MSGRPFSVALPRPGRPNAQRKSTPWELAMPHSRHAAAGCAGFRRSLSRRELLRAGAVCGLGLGLPELLQARATVMPHGTFGQARSVIVLYLHGGHAQQET